MTTQEFLAKARELRASADEARRTFMDFLCEAESQPEIWQGSGMSFPEFVEKNDICKAVTYIKYKRVRDTLVRSETEGVGTHAVVAAGSLREPGAQREVIAEAKKWEQENGTTISEQSAERIARDTKMRLVGASKGHSSYLSLLKDNERLVEENVRLRAEQTALRAEIRNLRTEIRRMKGSAKGKAA